MKPVIIIVGKSGSGKNFVFESIGLRYVPGYTERPLRSSDNKHLYHKILDKKLLDTDEITGETYFNGYYYWTLMKDINNTEYDFMILSKEGLENFLKKYENRKYKKRKYDRDFQIIYLHCNFFKRFKNMYKRGDKLLNIIKRLIHDFKAFKGIEELIIKNKGTLIEI